MNHNFPVITDGIHEVSFTIEDVNYEIENEEAIKKWLKTLIERMGNTLHSLNFILCSDEYLHQLNIQYLDHDTLTDVITFYYSPLPIIHGDIFISIDRVKENANKYGVSFLNELHRVMAHGVLHLSGLGDKTEDEARLMRTKENEALEVLASILKTETGINSDGN